ncbi:uncharacterized protein LOC108597170 [Drosophila busckii]|uniref:uncharacterized protein LOC108597170 n=1 Tax=Drosophila busckii TaxID=30019 RepID=UPI00083F44AD|nr:uncharacterized protein LOC108597170 [Drosophila busckii]
MLSCINNNLQLSCIFVGLLELTLSIARFYVDQFSCCCIYNACAPYFNHLQDATFGVQFLSAFMLIVGAGKRIRGCLYCFIALSIASIGLYAPIFVQHVNETSYLSEAILWSLLTIPFIVVFWFIAYSYGKQLKSEEEMFK